ncbi:glycosyltransferase family 2 protein [Pseudodonghicola xiamenensis]|uniref:Glycosyltransferase 2-like domain-containing protein n=1 Tax=Pseudodonghicola xiamenensis TaxID=337702 RepID=A0A8J3H9B7_9RHOB|nr:glycosyltransferase family A protein [Pseudodonghicola xiamenensis]GHG94104.1 hypothetical protein GCM10010961_27000 [Pseudodonghicola xiamenensis]
MLPLPFTIVIPCFNDEAILEKTLKSIRFQTHPDWEALIIDDGSNDLSREIATLYTGNDSRFRLIRADGSGRSAARNIALTQAQGNLIAFCDPGDIWEASKLARMERLFADPSIDAAYARVALFDGAVPRGISATLEDDLTVQALVADNPVVTLSNFVVRRDVFAATGGFDTALQRDEDLEWLIRLCACGFRVVGMKDALVHHPLDIRDFSEDLDSLRANREAVLATALRFGHRIDPRAEAIHLRYLAQRALRQGAPVRDVLRLALTGLSASPAGFFSDLRRGTLTLGAALSAPFLPPTLRRMLFA